MTAKNTESKVTLTVEADVGAFEVALEKEFKPALHAAIQKCVDEFIGNSLSGCVRFEDGGSARTAAENPCCDLAPGAEAGLLAMAALRDDDQVHSFAINIGKGVVQVMRLGATQEQAA
ncbi:hypothetical protein [Phaeobacter sp. C3_T13_0]|uniref:hypothetical protein n=1 Tax=Phaeobacter cretensis TaxID=3342641 RepID=UPI0039BD66C0